MLLSFITHHHYHQNDTCCYSSFCRASAWRKKTNARRRKLKLKPIISVLRLLVLGIAGTTFDFHFLETNLTHDIYPKEYNHIKIHSFLEIMIGYEYLTLLSTGLSFSGKYITTQKCASSMLKYIKFRQQSNLSCSYLSHVTHYQ